MLVVNAINSAEEAHATLKISELMPLENHGKYSVSYGVWNSRIFRILSAIFEYPPVSMLVLVYFKAIKKAFTECHVYIGLCIHACLHY